MSQSQLPYCMANGLARLPGRGDPEIFRPCIASSGTTAGSFHCWEPMRFACGLAGSTQAESRFRSGMSYR